MSEEWKYWISNMRVEIVRWRHRVGLLMIGVPVLCLILLIIFGTIVVGFKIANGEDRPKTSSLRFETGEEIPEQSLNHKIETRIVGDQYYVRYVRCNDLFRRVTEESDPFKEVSKNVFDQVKKRENRETRNANISFFALLSFVLGVLFVRGAEPPRPVDPKALRVLRALERGKLSSNEQ